MFKGVDMKKRLKVLSVLSLAALSVGALLVNGREYKEVEAVGNYSTDASTYYNGITATSGKQLAAQLHDLITSTHRYYTSYADNGANGYQKQTDQYYENGNKVSGYIYEFYSGVKWPNAWAATAGNTSGGYNREHCWCQSNSVNAAGTQMWGEHGGGSDMHHIRPVEVRLNSTRNNNVYGETSNRDSNKVYAKYGSNQTYAHGGYLNGNVFEPLDSKKGDVARIILYTYLHYNSYTISDLFGSYGTTNGSGTSSYFSTSLLSLTKTTNQKTEAKALEMLLSWNSFDPVDEIEQRRNEQVAILQGNRNPFIDNSSYADMIWGNGGSSTTPTVNSVSVEPTTLNLDLNGTKTGNLTATVNVSNGAPTTVSWTSSNENVATVSSNGEVTAVAKGSCTITATSTYNSNKSASCSVKVVDSGSGGGVPVDGEFTWNLAVASYEPNPTEDLVTWSNEYATMESIRTNTSNTKANNYLGGDSNNRTSSRFYKSNRLTITPLSGATITSIVFTATSDSYANALNSSTWTNATSSASSTTVTVTPTNGAEAISAVVGNTCGFTACKVNYTTNSGGGSTATLDSISLNTSNVLLEFTVDDDFDFSGLVVTAYYDDGSEDIVTPTSVSTPDMTTAGTKEVTVSYTENDVTKTATYSIEVIEEAIELYASTTRLFHPGETITKDDIYVEDNFDNAITDFTFSDYQFKYEDAASGGEISEKEFVDAIEWDGVTCSLTAQVSRVAYVAPTGLISDTLDKAATTIPNTYYDAWSGVSGSSGAVYAGFSGGQNDDIQLKSAVTNNSYYTNKYSGIITTSSGGKLASVTVTWDTANTTSGRVLNVYGKNTAYTDPSELYSEDSDVQGELLGTITCGTSTTLVVEGEYTYVGVRSNYGAMYLTDITFTYEGEGTETASTLANFIMFEDTNGQCVSKLDDAIKIFTKLSKSERTLFMSSEDYVLKTARERLEAWARNQEKEIVYVNNDYSFASSIKNEILSLNENDNSQLIIIIASAVSLLSFCFLIVIKKKRANRS